ncbi:MAG: sigma-70 family RNA polymerase sigma factor [Acidobacteria bacterium]|nr:sigma-70 family RNA polymerase sigma factor [Acidobacteriota bacterium]
MVRRVRGGEFALYEILMRRHNLRLYRVARSILRNDSEVEDVMQETHVRAYENLDRFAGKSKFSTWLTKIAVYESLARVRRAGQIKELESFSEWSLHSVAKGKGITPDPEWQTYGRELRGSVSRP